MQPDNQQQDLEDVSSSLRFPVFQPNKVHRWFIQIETFFTLKKITSDTTKYHHLVCALPDEVANEVEDLLEEPQSTDRYGHLKKAILERLSETTETRMEQLLFAEQIADRKPSQFLRRLRQLRGSEIPSQMKSSNNSSSADYRKQYRWW
jgi:hypothetical protein